MIRASVPVAGRDGLTFDRAVELRGVRRAVRAGDRHLAARAVVRQGRLEAVVHPDGRVEGWLGGACAEPTVVRDALEALQDGRPRLLVLGEPTTDRGDATGSSRSRWRARARVRWRCSWSRCCPRRTCGRRPLAGGPHARRAGRRPRLGVAVIDDGGRPDGWSGRRAACPRRSTCPASAPRASGRRRHPGPLRRAGARGGAGHPRRLRRARRVGEARRRRCSPAPRRGARRTSSWPGCARPPAWTSAATAPRSRWRCSPSSWPAAAAGELAGTTPVPRAGVGARSGLRDDCSRSRRPSTTRSTTAPTTGSARRAVSPPSRPIRLATWPPEDGPVPQTAKGSSFGDGVPTGLTWGCE